MRLFHQMFNWNDALSIIKVSQHQTSQNWKNMCPIEVCNFHRWQYQTKIQYLWHSWTFPLYRNSMWISSRLHKITWLHDIVICSTVLPRDVYYSVIPNYTIPNQNVFYKWTNMKVYGSIRMGLTNQQDTFTKKVFHFYFIYALHNKMVTCI